MANIAGTVESVTTYRDGHFRNTRDVYVPSADYKEFLEKWHHTTAGCFAYKTQTLQQVSRKPKTVNNWRD